MVGSAFAPCMAAAWLLTSRVGLDSCDSVLRFCILRQEDLDCAFLEGGGSSSEEGRRVAHDGVLQGLAALEVGEAWLRFLIRTVVAPCCIVTLTLREVAWTTVPTILSRVSVKLAPDYVL